MVQHVPTAGCCPTLLFGIVTRSLACFCRALGCCVRRLTALAISAFICPSQATVCLGFFLTIPPRNALHSMHTKSLKLPDTKQSSEKSHAAKHEEHGRNHEDLLAPWVAFNAEAMHQPDVLCPLSNLSACCYLFSSKTFSVKNQATNGKKRPLLHLLLLVYMNCQDDHNTMRTIQHLDLSRLWPLQSSGTVGKGHPFSIAVIQCAFPASKHLKSRELLKHAQLASHCAG